LRRCGRMRPSQKRRQEELYAGIEFETKALERSFIELLAELRVRPIGCKTVEEGVFDAWDGEDTVSAGICFCLNTLGHCHH